MKLSNSKTASIASTQIVRGYTSSLAENVTNEKNGNENNII
jgi:hypothetical protein